MQSIADRLFPDQPGKLRLRVVGDTAFNAFTWPSGGIYFHTGALLRIQDEAQLASVMGHEGIHFTADHGFKTVVRGKRTAGFVAFVSLVDPLLTPLLAYSSLAGFSREHEREADAGGFSRMADAGYDTAAAGELFSRMGREFEACKDKQGPYFWASHPRIKERIANFAALNAGRPPGGERNSERYRQVTERARMYALQRLHLQGDGKRLVFLLETESLMSTLPPQARYYLGEGYRLRNLPGDADKALAAYAETIRTAPNHGLAYGALGLDHYRRGRRAEALPLLERFLELEPNAQQAAYARSYVTQIKKELSP